ncbi:hypothetical protein GGF46_000880 [Coemansia sp. RSA 552]|nr:hypothetical protein GGF46_000880 [Coemansia sp. RSA 552]
MGSQPSGTAPPGSAPSTPTRRSSSSGNNNNNNNGGGEEAATNARDDVCDGSQDTEPAPAADLQETPTTQRAGGGTGLGLRPPSTHTPENASMYSCRSTIESVSGESKPPSQKSSSMSFVRRLRRLSSAALHGKVNRLFSRPNNLSQDSLPPPGPLTPSACPSPGAMPSSPVVPASGAPGDVFPGPPPALHAANCTPADRRAGNTPGLPPVPPPPVSSRRNRALTEVTPLAIRGCLEPAPKATLDTTPAQKPPPALPRTRTTNSPLVASPLSRKSFHSLSATSSREDMRTPERSARGLAKSPSTNYRSLRSSTSNSPRIKSPKLIRATSHTPQSPRLREAAPPPPPSPRAAGSSGDTRRSDTPHASSYRLSIDNDSELAYPASQTPSPPERAGRKSQSRLVDSLGTPTMPRRRTALATLGWPSSKGSWTGKVPDAGPSQPNPPPVPKSNTARLKTASSSGADSPTSLLSAFQLRSRVSSGLFRQPSSGTSARSSMSITSDSARSWASATSDTDKDNEGDDTPRDSQSNLLSIAALELHGGEGKGPLAEATGGPSKLSSEAEAAATAAAAAASSSYERQQWTPAARVQGFFYPSILDWHLSQNESTTPHSHSPSSSTAYEPAGAASSTQPKQRAQTGSRLSSHEGAMDPRYVSEPAGAASAAPSVPITASPGMLPPPPPAASSQAIRPRGGSHPIHLAKTATANAIRLKEKSAVQAGDGSISAPYRSSLRVSPGSAPESSSIDMAAEANRSRLRMRATSASHHPVSLSDEIAGMTQPQVNSLGRSSVASGTPTSRPPSSMSAYTMSPVPSSAGDEPPSSLGPHLWQTAGMFRASPERHGDPQLAAAGMHTPSSTSSPSAHHHGSQGSHQLRLNTSSVQRSASGHSVSSGISELLEPSSVSVARKDALRQVLVVSKSRADTEIDKILRQWKETDGGTIVCALDTEARPGVGDEDAIILQVKRGHRRSTSDMKRADGDRNEFRRRVIDLANLIRSSSVSEVSNDIVTRGITEKLYGLLTEQRTRFPGDANAGTLILDVLYQFSAVSQTVSQMAMSFSAMGAPRTGISGDASPAVSQFPSPQLAPELPMGRGTLSTLMPLSSALAGHHGNSSTRHAASKSQSQREGADYSIGLFTESTRTPHSSVGRAQSINSTNISDVLSDLNEYRISRTASEGPGTGDSQLQKLQHSSTDSYPSGSTSAHMRPADSGSRISSPRLLPGTEYSSTTSLPSLLASVHHGSGHSISGSIGRPAIAGSFMPTSPYSLPGTLPRQRLHLPPSSVSQSSRMSIDAPDVETDVSSRPSLDDSNLRPSLDRQPSMLSISSEVGESSIPPRSRLARASLQPQSQAPCATPERTRELVVEKPKRWSRPASMQISTNGFGMFRRASDSVSRQERLARLLNDDTDFSDSAPTSPVDTPAHPYIDMGEDSIPPHPPLTAGLVTIPEAKLSSDMVVQDSSASAYEFQSSSVPEPTADIIAEVQSKLRRHMPEDAIAARRGSRPSVIMEEQEEPSSEGSAAQSVAEKSGRAASASEEMRDTETPSPMAAAGGRRLSPEPVSDSTELADGEMVVCRICERSIFRAELGAHSDVCILEQTRAMKLDEVNQRMKRLRDSISKRLVDLKKARQWDRGAVRESERIIRITDRAIFWPEGDSQQELIVAKAKFAKYMGKLRDVTGTDTSPRSSKVPAEASRDDTGPSRLPRADIETLWLTRQLLARIQDKCDVIEEFEKQFARLERQDALLRESEAADAAEKPGTAFLPLPTWSQLAESNHRSPAASERTSMDFVHSQSESGSATPDVATPHTLSVGKLSGSLSRRHSKATRTSRRSLSRMTKLGSDAAEADSHGGSRKLVSLFAALFRSGNGGLSRTRDGSVFRRKNTPSPFAPGSLPASSRSNSAVQRLSQNPSTPSAATSGNSSGTNIQAEAASASNEAAQPAAAAADIPPASPVTRQRNNSQLSTMRGTPEPASRVQRMPATDDFEFIKPISRGAFGSVYLTRKKATKDLFAIKVMRKKDMINKNMVTQALAERRALSLLSTDWVVQLYYAFHSSKHLFLVMEYLIGGDLAGLLSMWGVMDEDSACFYIGEIACAIDYLHCNSIVHRDIKPDNVILASDGHIKLTDFGLSQVAVRSGADGKGMDGSESNATLDSPTSDTTPLGDGELTGEMPNKADWAATRAQTRRDTTAADTPPQTAKALPLSKRAHMRKSSRGFLGTPDYLAPELLLGAGNGLAVDWWALGVCLFEFVCGYPPFMDETPEAIFRNILNHAIDWPDEDDYVSAEAAELINALLRPEPATRAHWKDIQASRLFGGWDLTNVRQRDPPFVPRPGDDVDTSYFETCQRKELQRLSNATFLQAEALKPQIPLQPSVPADDGATTAEGTATSSRKGSRRGSRRQRSAAGSFVAGASGSGTHTSIGQLKKLFSDMAVSGSEDTSAGESEAGGSRRSRSNSHAAQDEQEEEEILDSSESSNDSFLAPETTRNKRASAALSAHGNGPASPSGAGEHSSINSLSDTDSESAAYGGGDRPAASGETASMVRSVSMSPPPAQPLLNHAKRAVCRPPSQYSDGAADAGLSGAISRSHSRCASVSTALAAGKKSSAAAAAAAKSRRPSQGADAGAGPDAPAGVLVRSTSTDERLQHAAKGTVATSAGPAPGPGEAGSSADGSELEDRSNEDDESERVFEDFSYKNLALLNHVNRGMSSSSGSASPMPERPAAQTSGASGNRTPVYGSSLGTQRDSPINAYEAG